MRRKISICVLCFFVLFASPAFADGTMQVPAKATTSNATFDVQPSGQNNYDIVALKNRQPAGSWSQNIRVKDQGVAYAVPIKKGLGTFSSSSAPLARGTAGANKWPEVSIPEEHLNAEEIQHLKECVEKANRFLTVGNSSAQMIGAKIALDKQSNGLAKTVDDILQSPETNPMLNPKWDRVTYVAEMEKKAQAALDAKDLPYKITYALNHAGEKGQYTGVDVSISGTGATIHLKPGEDPLQLDEETKTFEDAIQNGISKVHYNMNDLHVNESNSEILNRAFSGKTLDAVGETGMINGMESVSSEGKGILSELSKLSGIKELQEAKGVAKVAPFLDILDKAAFAGTEGLDAYQLAQSMKQNNVEGTEVNTTKMAVDAGIYMGTQTLLTNGLPILATAIAGEGLDTVAFMIGDGLGAAAVLLGNAFVASHSDAISKILVDGTNGLSRGTAQLFAKLFADILLPLKG